MHSRPHSVLWANKPFLERGDCFQGANLPLKIVEHVKNILKGDHMQTGHELFVHGLNDMMDAERQLIQALEEFAGDSSRADLKKASQRD